MDQQDTEILELKMIPLQQIKIWYKDFVKFSQEILKEDLDYGVVPGASKPTLLKPGAEKLRLVYGLSANIFQTVDNTKIDLENPFVDVTYKCEIRAKDGQLLTSSEGNCNSLESRYRYTWIPVNKKPTKDEMVLQKARKQGRWVKIDNQWIWHEKIKNKEVLNFKNTIMKIAQKRAFVGAILLATGASEFFTQDLEDMDMLDTFKTEEQPQDISTFENKITTDQMNYLVKELIPVYAKKLGKNNHQVQDSILNKFKPSAENIQNLTYLQAKKAIELIENALSEKSGKEIEDKV